MIDFDKLTEPQRMRIVLRIAYDHYREEIARFATEAKFEAADNASKFWNLTRLAIEEYSAPLSLKEVLDTML